MDDIRIYSPQEVAEARGRGEQKLIDLGKDSSDSIKLLRHQAKHDLFFLSYGVLGYDKLSDRLHLHFCRWLQNTENEQFRLILLPRSHFKSTIATISDSIRIALPDDIGTATYPRNLGFNVRVLLAHETDGSAQRFLSSIRDFIYRSEVLLALYPEITPEKGRTDNKGELELNRERTWSEPTFSTMGVGGKKQGAHFDYIKADDLQGETATASETEKKSLMQWVDNLQSFLVTPMTDHIDFIGTRWAFDDVWNHITNMYADQLVTYHRAVEEYSKEAKKKVPIFPEQFTEKSLKILRKNKKVFNAQYLNDPKEGASSFQDAWLRYWQWYDTRNVAIFDGESSSIYGISDLDKVILIDPAMTGNFGYCVTGTTPKNQHLVLESHKQEWEQPEFVNFVFQQVQRWNPRLVVIEGVLFSHLYQHWFVREMAARRVRFNIEAVPTRQKSKDSRIMGLAPFFEAGHILFHQEQHDIIQEFREFGASSNIHILDALAYGPQFWRTPPPLQLVKSMREATSSLLLKGQDKQTGYSTMYDDD